MKFYYENVLANQNKTAKNNIVWVCDITEIGLKQNKKFYIFLCLDIHTNTIIAQSTSQSIIKSQSIVRCLTKAIKKRFRIFPKTRVILHTDRGTQFSSKCHNNFLKEFEQFIMPSMSRENTPTDNAVAERFMRTFKEHRINGKIIEQEIQEAIILNAESKTYSNIVTNYIKSLNEKPNKKSYKMSPERHDRDVSIASLFMCEPPYTKAFSKRYDVDNRRNEISKFKSQNIQVISFLKELAAKQAEIVDKTPFDHLEGNIALELIEKPLREMYELIDRNQYIIQKSVKGAIEPVNENVDELREQFYQEMESLNKKIDKLLPKQKKEQEVQQLRDPVDINLFPVFLTNAGNSYQRKKDLIRAQLRITYTILYHCGLRINEIRHLNQKDLENAIDAAQFNLVHHKTKQAHIHVLSKKAIQDLKDLKLEFFIIFEKYQYKYLFGKQKPITDKSLIK